MGSLTVVIMVFEMVGNSEEDEEPGVESVFADVSASSSGSVGIPSALLSDRERCMIIAFGGII